MHPELKSPKNNYELQYAIITDSINKFLYISTAHFLSKNKKVSHKDALIFIIILF